MITFIFLLGGLIVVAIIGAGVYFSRSRKAKGTVAQSSPRNVSRATGSGDD